MDTQTVLELLGYASSPNFLTQERLGGEREHSHVYRRAMAACSQNGGRLAGVYALREGENVRSPSTPVVYVAEAPSDEAADKLHQKVWNQSVVPFLLVRVERRVRLYSGFEYSGEKRGAARAGVLEASVAVDSMLSRLADLHANSIDAGGVWRHRSVDPGKRLDRKLLTNLKNLGARLRKEHLPAGTAHGLIGKFVYLRYLRDRGILSERRLEELDVDARVFGRKTSIGALQRLVSRIDDWLNGSVFPIPLTGKHAPTEEQVRLVASVFLGDEAESGQLHLDFRAYDFSYIPIETLSVIYEQFLAAEDKQSDAGAYYTPLAVVNFLLAEMDQARPLTLGMRVLDPACGSGAFLVQCYRRLIEERIRSTGKTPRPAELRELLTRHVFGVDRDGDACRVAELSLLLTMLDYIDPPDLVGSRFKLPELHGSNVFQGDFFDADGDWRRIQKDGFDWVVGNPPWLQLRDASKDDEPAVAWINRHLTTHPVVRMQVAEAFAWKAAEHSKTDGVVGLLLPAMSLVTETATFREAFFQKHSVLAVANFTNLRRMLFASRAETAAVAMIYSPHPPGGADETLYVYSPLVVNQEVTRPPEPGVRIEPWTITVDRSEIRSVRIDDVLREGARVWTTAMWGSNRDLRLLSNAEKRCGTLSDLVDAHSLKISQGLELREKSAREPVEPVGEVANKIELDMEALKNVGRIHVFPPNSLTTRIAPSRAYARAGRAGPVEICRPPHVIVNASRTFAVYSDEYLVVPARQIGIAGERRQENVLRALALYLSSDFVDYHRFLDSSQVTVRGVSTLASLKRLPTPVAALSPAEVARWAELHREIVAASKKSSTTALTTDDDNRAVQKLSVQLNELVADALSLSEPERWLIQDLVHVRMRLADGQIGPAATRGPTKEELGEYAFALTSELDAFLDASGFRHQVEVVHSRTDAAVRIVVGEGKKALPPKLIPADSDAAKALQRARDRIEETRSQWIYFDRNMIVYERNATIILKPSQRVWWTRSQALADADELIADAILEGANA